MGPDTSIKSDGLDGILLHPGTSVNFFTLYQKGFFYIIPPIRLDDFWVEDATHQYYQNIARVGVIYTHKEASLEVNHEIV